MSRLICLLSAVTLLAMIPVATAEDKKDDTKKTEQKSDPKPSSANDYTSVGEFSGILARGPGKSGNTITMRGAKITVRTTASGRATLRAAEENQTVELTPDCKVRFMQPPPRTDE